MPWFLLPFLITWEQIVYENQCCENIEYFILDTLSRYVMIEYILYLNL